MLADCVPLVLAGSWGGSEWAAATPTAPASSPTPPATFLYPGFDLTPAGHARRDQRLTQQREVREEGPREVTGEHNICIIFFIFLFMFCLYLLSPSPVLTPIAVLQGPDDHLSCGSGARSGRLPADYLRIANLVFRTRKTRGRLVTGGRAGDLFLHYH